MTTDSIAALQSEGWPIEEGDLGENVLVSGLPYNFFRVGQKIVLGSVMVGARLTPISMHISIVLMYRCRTEAPHPFCYHFPTHVGVILMHHFSFDAPCPFRHH